MTMSEWAKNEVEKATNGKVGYYESAVLSAYKAFLSLCEDGHSGTSIHVAKSVLNRLIDGLPLSEITDKDFEGVEPIREEDGMLSYQCPRMSSLFKEVHKDGTVTYHDNNRVTMVDENGLCWHSGTASKAIDEIHPITLPYYPSGKSYRVYGYSLIVDDDLTVRCEIGTYNFVYLDYYLDPNGKRHPLDILWIEDEGIIPDGEKKETVKRNLPKGIEESKRLHQRANEED